MKLNYISHKGISFVNIDISDTPKYDILFNLDAPVLKSQIYINISLLVKFWIINRIVSFSIGLH